MTVSLILPFFFRTTTKGEAHGDVECRISPADKYLSRITWILSAKRGLVRYGRIAKGVVPSGILILNGIVLQRPKSVDDLENRSEYRIKMARNLSITVGVQPSPDRSNAMCRKWGGISSHKRWKLARCSGDNQSSKADGGCGSGASHVSSTTIGSVLLNEVEPHVAGLSVDGCGCTLRHTFDKAVRSRGA